MNILSIQSSVAFGHVGNSAAVFPLQRLGFEVWPVNTVHFSNHTGYGQWRGPVLPAEQVADVVRGVEERGVLASCDAVLSGYMGDVGLGAVIVDAVDRVRSANPAAIYCCDPVMGDVGRGFFVKPGLPEFIRDHAVPRATIITPNQFELEYLTAREISSLDDALVAAQAARRLGPDLVLVTSLVRADADREFIEMLAVDGEGAWLVATPRLPLNVNGAGDAASAIFLAHRLRGADTARALAATAASIFAILEATHRAGTREIGLVAAQDAIANPDIGHFAVRRVA